MVNKRRCNDFICASFSHCLCWSFYFQNIITFLFEKLCCAVEILIWSDAVDFLIKLLGMPYSVVTAQQACSTEMVKESNFEYYLQLWTVHHTLKVDDLYIVFQHTGHDLLWQLTSWYGIMLVRSSWKVPNVSQIIWTHIVWLRWCPGFQPQLYACHFVKMCNQ